MSVKELVKETCTHCHQSWTPRVADPKQCPFCKSTRWRGEANLHTCKQCGDSWPLSGTTIPAKCPHCQSRDWDTAPQAHCQQCDNRWFPRTTNIKQCPACKSTKWDQPRTPRAAAGKASPAPAARR